LAVFTTAGLIPIGSQLVSEDVLYRIERSHPAFEREAARTTDLEPTAVRRRRTEMGQQAAVLAMATEEELKIGSERHYEIPAFRRSSRTVSTMAELALNLVVQQPPCVGG
jgi:hypothetical protein